MKYQAILLDMNGVLVNDETIHEEAFGKVLADGGHILSHEEYKKHFAGRTDREGFKNYLSSKDSHADVDEILEAKNNTYKQATKKGFPEYKGTKKFLQQADLKGFKLAVVTGAARDEAKAVLDGLGIASFFAALITAEDFERGKPNPDSYLRAAQRLKVKPEDCIVIEDAPSGIMAAKSAGMRCIALTTTHSKTELAQADVITGKLDISLLA